MANKEKFEQDEISSLMNDSARLTQVIQSGIRSALLVHKKLGNPVCEWRDGKVVWVQPEDIPV